MDVRSREGPKLRVIKHDSKSEARSSSVSLLFSIVP
jgi:hypothetical protein